MKMSLPDPDMKPPFDRSAIESEIWAPGQFSFTLDPLFVQRAGSVAEDDGFIVLLVHNASEPKGRTELCILDAQKISAGMTVLPALMLAPVTARCCRRCAKCQQF